MSYLRELRDSWRYLLAATLGMATGMSTAGMVTSAIAPTLIANVGWTQAQFALVGSIPLVTAFVFPFVGRLADILGVRWTASIGLITLPLIYLAYSRMSGQLSVYIGLFVLQSSLCVTTTATVYTRLVVEHITKARGLALAIVASGPALSGAIGIPLLNAYIEAKGWREAFQALAIFSAVTGAATFLLIPKGPQYKRETIILRRPASEDYPLIFKSRAFWILAAAMFLCNLPQTIVSSQLKLLLLANGVSGEGAAIMFSALSVGMLCGRFLTGIFLDRMNPYFVACITLAAPSFGLFLLASPLDTTPIILVSVFAVGFAFGSEGDIVAFLVSRLFGVEVYSSVMGLLTFAMASSVAAGAVLLSTILSFSGSFEPFLWIVGIAVLLGSLFLVALGQFRQNSDDPADCGVSTPAI